MPKRITLILPGFSNSGPEHWQSHWERIDPSCRRVEQADWEAPRCADWVATLDAAISSAPGPVVLVAPSDPEGPAYPTGPTGFAPMPLDRLPFRSIVVASTNDVYVTAEKAREYAAAWGSELVDVGAAGHINSASGLGDWPAGRVLLARLHESPEELAAIQVFASNSPSSRDATPPSPA